MEVLLTIYSDEKKYFAREVPLPCVIGRGKACDVAIVHPLVSRRHCEIYEENGVVAARDLGSLNGTFFQGARIARGVTIPYGSSFSIGRLMLRVDRARSDDGTSAEEQEEMDEVEIVESESPEPAEMASQSQQSPLSLEKSSDPSDAVDLDDLLSDRDPLSEQRYGDSSVIDLDQFFDQDEK